MLAKLCVEGLVPFDCHEKAQLCRGFIAAVNLRGAPTTRTERRHAEAAKSAAEMLGLVIRTIVQL